MRPPSSAASATRRPCPSSPSTADAGTSQSSKVSETVLDERMPIFSSWRPTARPGVPPSTRKAVMPRFPAPTSVRAQTMITPATVAAGDPLLGPVQHPAVAPPLGPGAHRVGVAPGLGLGEAERAGQPLPGGQPRQAAGLLLLGAEAGDGLAHHVGDGHGDRERAVGRGPPPSPPGRRPPRPPPSRRRRPGRSPRGARAARARGRAPPGSGPVRSAAGRGRLGPLDGERAGRGRDGLLDLGPVEVHRASPSGRWRRSPAAGSRSCPRRSR